jgi:hypothetical protein
LSCRITRMRPPNPARTCGVGSVEPSSTTRISSSPRLPQGRFRRPVQCTAPDCADHRRTVMLIGVCLSNFGAKQRFITKCDKICRMRDGFRKRWIGKPKRQAGYQGH